jgi:hypothetical protein
MTKAAALITAFLLILLSAGCAGGVSGEAKDFSAKEEDYLSAEGVLSALPMNGKETASPEKETGAKESPEKENGGASAEKETGVKESPEKENGGASAEKEAGAKESPEGKDRTYSPERERGTDISREKESGAKTPAEDKACELIDISIVRTNWTEAGVILEKCVNSDRLAISSQRHLPVYKAASPAELSELTADLSYYLPAFTEFADIYDAKFFKERILAVVYLTSGSGSYRYGVKDIKTEDGFLTIIAQQTNSPEIGTCDMAGWLIAVPLPASDAEAALDARFAGREDFAGISLPVERDPGKLPGEIPFGSFSFEEVKGSIPEGWASANFRTEGFVNTEPAEYFDPVKLGRAELALPYEPELAQTLYDPAEDVFAVHFFSAGFPGETVYLNGRGITVLIVFDE